MSLLLKVGVPVPLSESDAPMSGSTRSGAGWDAFGWLAGIRGAGQTDKAPGALRGRLLIMGGAL